MAPLTSPASRRSNPWCWSGPTKCMRPHSAVSQPASDSWCAKVGTCDGSTPPLVQIRRSLGYCPVIKAMRDGTHSGPAQYVCEKETPDAASRSRFGVRTNASLACPISRGLCWSDMMTIKFGRAMQAHPLCRKAEENGLDAIERRSANPPMCDPIAQRITKKRAGNPLPPASRIFHLPPGAGA